MPCRRHQSSLLAFGLLLLLLEPCVRPCMAIGPRRGTRQYNLDTNPWNLGGMMAQCAAERWRVFSFAATSTFAAYCTCHLTLVTRFQRQRQTLTMRGYITNMMLCARDSNLVVVASITSDIMECFARATGHWA